MGRLLDRDPDDWNKAADYVINNMLIKAGYQLPKGALYNPAWESLSSEEIYDIIHKEKPQDKDGVGKDLHKPGSLTDGYKKGTKADVAAAQNKISTNLNKAKTASAMSGKSAGDIPGEIQRHIEKLLNPVIPWNQYMTRFYCDVVKLDYTWKKPNKRYMPDFYLPSQGTPTIGNVVIAVDTSCSVSQKQLKEIYSEIDSLRQVYQPNCLTRPPPPRKIQTIKHLYPHDELLGVKLGGGGGTSFIPVMEYCDEHQPAVLMYFTDLEAEHITDEPDYPTLWICYSKHKPQGIGETIYYKPEYAP
jgi:predicted metal-dependent peptidase